MDIIVDKYMLIAFCLLCVLLGVLAHMIAEKLDWGWVPFRNKIVKLKPHDPKFRYGLMCGLTAGYYAATGEIKDPEDVYDKYFEELEKEEQN